MSPPRWTDEVRVRQLVDETIEADELEAEREFYLLRWDTHPGIPARELWEDMERTAVAEAERGRFDALADLVQPADRMIAWLRSLGHDLGTQAKALVAGRLRGIKRGRGRPPLTEDEKRALTPTHDAADEVPTIMLILRNHYPGQDAKQISDRAMAIAGERAHMETPFPAQTLSNYIEHSGHGGKSKRRRLATRRKTRKEPPG